MTTTITGTTTTANDKFAIIVLAAGQSSRLGQMKQLITIQEKSLLEVQLTKALTLTHQVYCVLGFEAKQLQTHIDHLPIKIIINEQWSAGMATSIAAGTKALANDISAVMIVLVDQWQLTATDLFTIESCWQNNPHAIVVASALSNVTAGGKEKMGPPVVFPQHYFSELAQLSGQEGAKSLLKKHQQMLLKVELAHAFIDLDIPEQLTEMNKVLSANLTS